MQIQPNSQASTVPPNVRMNNFTPQAPLSYNNPSSNNASHQPSNNKEWWQNMPPYNPYRTTNQDYGPSKNQSYPTSNVNAQPNIYKQGPNTNVSSGNSSATTFYSGNSSMPYNSAQPPQHM
ncbi:unnamed protein product [Rotaria sordida]|uniref:Uncharacterized protein n=1 Tax=Rotaria sordida TaxID=392033 RepID=A0A814RQN8_9BILA|nr:unnamed protein product [Rotaria sordida]CAF1364386.1 unnamed protein product [Rotaria sordida]